MSWWVCTCSPGGGYGCHLCKPWNWVKTEYKTHTCWTLTPSKNPNKKPEDPYDYQI